MLEKLFRLKEAGTTPGREILGGVTTFLTMAYIIAVNPHILGQTGMSVEGVMVATCVASAIATFVMAFAANYPIALAPGMGLNAFFAFTICLGSARVPWPTALGIVFWSGVLFLVLTLTRARQAIVQAVPPVIKLAGAVGIGLFIAFIGLKQGGIIVDHPQTLVTMGDPTSRAPLLAIAGIVVTLIFIALKVRTAIFWGLAITAILGALSGTIAPPTGVVSMPGTDLPGLKIDLLGALHLKYVPIILVILFFDLFDTMGTLMGVGHEGGFLRDGQLPRMERAMLADATGTCAGALLGTSPVTSYIESGTGVGVGARTGLAGVVTGLLFLLALFITPLVKAVAAGTGDGLNPVTAPALVLVGTLMVRAVREIRWDEMTEAVPAFFTMLLMPLTFNISHGLAVGIVVYVVVKVGARKHREVHWLIYGLAGAFLFRYAFLPV